ncbi:MAG: glycosyltransferase family 4 protein [Clostridia bacterium]|nr:glycosyltransferase family 4 protein [Clostridia bacterium]
MNSQNEMRIVFLGTLYPPEMEQDILSKSKTKASSAPNVFQWNLIRGVEEALGRNIEIVNGLPVGAWPGYGDKLLPDRAWKNGDADCHEVGCINLPFVKQAMRAAKAKRLLKKLLRPGDRVVLYSAYMPFLKALHKLPRDIDVTAVITDLPEFYDLGQVSALRKMLRRMQNRLVYKYMQRVNRFVLLTKQMHQPLKVGDRPWMLMEGICTAEAGTASEDKQERAILYAGTLHYQFGIKNLLDAFRMMEDPSAQLWICGGGEAEKEIRELCEIDPRVKFFGFLSQSQVADLRSRAAVLVNPRTNEGEYTKYSFPSKTMEYMASGKPVVMYRLDGIPREYDPHLYYVADSTPASLADSLTYVLTHPEEARQKGLQAQQFVLENKNRGAQGDRLVKFLQRS